MNFFTKIFMRNEGQSGSNLKMWGEKRGKKGERGDI